MPASLHAQKNLQDNVPPIRPPCPTCGEAMRMVSVTSANGPLMFDVGYFPPNTPPDGSYLKTK
jgi:hypothetical protein